LAGFPLSQKRTSVFRAAAIASGVITQEQIEMACAMVRSEPGGPPAPIVFVSDEQLSAKLVEMDLLTPYQAGQLKDGKHKLHLGPYLITDFIGQGGMGQVFKAVHKVMGRECAVKVLPINKATPQAIANFTREIRTQAQLDHANLVRAFDAGHDGNVHFLVTEFVAGTDLRKLVRSQGPLTMQLAASVVMQAAQGLAHAHILNLVHRDVKPGNILVTPEGRAKVSDLGLAGFLHEADADPRAGKIVGTADYLAPEIIQNPTEVTPLSDIYSLGCTLYYAICGKVPFPGGTTKEKARRHCGETPWHPRRFNPDISEEFVEVIADMMEKDPKERVQTAQEVVNRLKYFAAERVSIPSEPMGKSPWLSPPLPTDGDDVLEEVKLPDSVELDNSRAESTSQISMGGLTQGISSQDTNSDPTPRRSTSTLLASPAQEARIRTNTANLLMALVVVVPLAMIFGAILGATFTYWVMAQP
jgi:serine/threonine protein kinase